MSDRESRDVVFGGVFTFAVGMLLGATLAGGCNRISAPGAADGQSFGGKVVDCTSRSVRENWPMAYPQVMTCLTMVMTSPMGCLDAIPAALKVGVEVVACIVGGAGKQAAAQAQANTSDVVSSRQAERAAMWLEARGIEFK